ncbi:calcium-binding protein [Paracoccus sp. (in: a-proteobacteria)]|uniref:calcium-binding protein n=1 Tax=Paracoccus sp. TaxID=267 RepID=UPI0026DF594A|nr:calcium-binding protein [Paracoccus sp. (in: a-proteobacteria)]MDO5369145.1 calcium-binding protein [Paracoccus sp. (in: a-proteobacteria)]
MSATAHINMINLQVMAEEVMWADRADGTYAGNIASNEKYYIWQSQFQTRPMGMENQPEAYARLLRQSLPDVNTLRLPFNAYSFNADGSLEPMYERFLVEAARQGFGIVMVYADGGTQQLGENNSADLAQMRDALGGSVHDRMIGTWERMLAWLDRHPVVDAAIYALEAANEPAAYGRAENLAGGSGEFVRLYGDHMAEFAALVGAHSDAKIMIGGWMYSAQFDVLAGTASSEGGRSVLDQIRQAAGGDLVWSAHLYPHWTRSAGQEIEGFESFIRQQYAALGDDDVILTETNALGSAVNDARSGDVSFWMARAYEVFADAGIGLGWFPGAETGGSSFVTINNGRFINFQHPDSYAHGMNGFLLDENDPARAGNDRITAALLPGNVYAEDGTWLNLDGLGYAAGHGGNDTLTAIDHAMNMLYGGQGNDVLTGTSGRDYLFGQGDDDTLHGGAGDDVLSGGDGDDVLHDGAGSDILTGGRGADHFILSAGKAVITDMRHDQGDRLTLGGQLWGTDRIMEAGQYLDHDGDGVVDDMMLDWGAGQVILMNHRRPDGIIQGTEDADSIAVGYQDIQGERFTRDGGRVHGLGGDDTITGGTGNDWLEGGAGDDSIAAGAGNDTLWGNDGADTLDGGNGNDLIRGGTGNDRLLGAVGNDTIHGDAGDDELLGGGGHDSLDGGDGADVIDGNADNDTITGGDGDDRLIGNGGHDLLLGGNHADTLHGGEGNDTLHGQSGDDTLYGNNGNDVLNGGDGDDYLDGGAGTDYLDGGNGNDQFVCNMNGTSTSFLTGGAGADHFVFLNIHSSGQSRATFTDFEIGVDSISIGGNVGMKAIMEMRVFGGLHAAGPDTVMKVGDDVYVFKNHDPLDFA